MSEHLLEYINGYNIFKITFKKSILVPAPIFKDFFSLNKINVKSYGEKKVPNKIDLSKCIMHVAQYHETFSSIAKTYTVNSRELINSNPSVRFLRPGVTLNVCAV